LLASFCEVAAAELVGTPDTGREIG
jgi:hypothetical protein